MSYGLSFIPPCLPSSRRPPFLYRFTDIGPRRHPDCRMFLPLLQNPKGVLWGSAGEPLAQYDVPVAPEARCADAENTSLKSCGSTPDPPPPTPNP